MSYVALPDLKMDSQVKTYDVPGDRRANADCKVALTLDRSRSNTDFINVLGRENS